MTGRPTIHTIRMVCDDILAVWRRCEWMFGRAGRREAEMAVGYDRKWVISRSGRLLCDD